MSEKVITGTTLKRVADELKMSRILVSDLAKGYKVSDWATVQDIVQNGLAPVKFNIGDQFIVDWVRSDIEKNQQEKTYQLTFDVVHFATVKDEEGNEHPGMYLCTHYATPFSIQFDAPENKPCEDETFQEGYYYYLKQENGSYVQQEVQPGAPIPEEGEYVRHPLANAKSVVRYGYDRWSHSAYRQWLNSDKGKGEWWTAQHDGDMPPKELPDHDGFMKGLDPAFLAVVKPVQVKTYKNTVTDDGTLETTNDRFFLACTEEMYGKPDLAGEAEAWEYWKQATGLEEPSLAACPTRIYKDMVIPTETRACRMRSVVPGDGRNVRLVGWSGQLDYYVWYAVENSLYAAPACVIW